MDRVYLSADPTPNAGYATAGVTIENGNYQDTGKITVAAVKITLEATEKMVGGGKTQVGGDYIPNATVDIYSKASGSDSYTLLDSLETDDEGDFGADYSIKKTTYFLAKSGGLSSKSVKTEVWSKVSLTGKALGKGKLWLKANGAPSAKGTLTFYRSVKGEDPVLDKFTSNSSGDGETTVKLPKGERKVYVIYKAPGTGAGTSKTLTITVK